MKEGRFGLVLQRSGAQINAAPHLEYARLVGRSPAALTAVMEPYLPIIYASPCLGR